MPKYHVNSTTGAMGRCHSTKGKCPFGGESGTDNHFDTQKDAIAASEKILEKQFQAMSSLKKISGEKNNTEKVVETKKAENNSTKIDKNNDKKIVKMNETFTTAPEPPIKGKNYTGIENSAWEGSRRAAVLEQEKRRTGKTYAYLPMKEYAKNIREDIKTAVAAGDLPKNFKYSVQTDTYSGGGSINIKVFNPEFEEEDIYDYSVVKNDPYEHGHRELKPEFREIEKRLKKIHSAWNYDRSDITTDYFDRGFYGQVKISDKNDDAYEKHYKASNEYKKTVRMLRAEGKTNDEIKKDERLIRARQKVLDAWEDKTFLEEKREIAQQYQVAIQEDKPEKTSLTLEYDNQGKGVIPWDKINEKAWEKVAEKRKSIKNN